MSLTGARGSTEEFTAGSGHHVEDTYELSCPHNTTGWRFTLSGTANDEPRTRHVDRRSSWAPRAAPKYLGHLHPERPDAWNCHFSVPGPGMYNVTVEQLAGKVVAHSVRTATREPSRLPGRVGGDLARLVEK